MVVQFKKNAKVLLAFLACLCLSSPGVALADEEDDIGRLVALVNAADPWDVAPVDVPTEMNGTDVLAVEADGGGQLTEIGQDGTIMMPVGDNQADMSLTMAMVGTGETREVASDGTVVFVGSGQGASVAIQVLDDGSAQVHTIISGSEEGVSFEFEISGPPGLTIVQQPEGSVAIVDEAGEWVGGIAAPWAVDANGRSVPTDYRIDGSTLVQTVYPGDEHAYPIVADPWLGKNVIQSTSVIQRSSGPAVSVVPTTWGRAVALNHGITRVSVYNAFRSEYKARVASKYEGQNMIWQLDCHVDLAPAKSAWNLDLNINRGSYAATLAHACN